MKRLSILILTLSITIFISCGKDDEPEVVPPQGYIVINDVDTIHFNHLRALKDHYTQGSDTFTLSVLAGVYPNGDITQAPTTSVDFSMNTTVVTGFFNDRRCANCYNNPKLSVSINGGYNSGDCYIDNATISTFSAELFYNKKADAETILFEGTLCQPTSDTTFKTLKVKGVLQDAPITTF